MYVFFAECVCVCRPPAHFGLVAEPGWRGGWGLHNKTQPAHLSARYGPPTTQSNSRVSIG